MAAKTPSEVCGKETSMKNIKDGGSAFPRPFSKSANLAYIAKTGMSMRDYFAAQAMQAIIAKLPLGSIGEKHLGQFLATTEEAATAIQMVCGGAYLYADAMLRERAKGQS
jgi:hypothetical protein